MKYHSANIEPVNGLLSNAMLKYTTSARAEQCTTVFNQYNWYSVAYATVIREYVAWG